MDENLLMNVLKFIKEGKSSELNNIPFKAREDILNLAKKEELIDGLTKTKDGNVGTPIITLKGIDYYEENKKRAKLYKTLKEIRGWISGY